MTIDLITKENHEFITSCFNKYPNLILQNEGYEYLNKSKFTEEEAKIFKAIEDILKDSIKGFSKLHNLRLSKKEGFKQLRFDYNYDADNPKGGYFIGVGYLLLDELLNGFNEQKP